MRGENNKRTAFTGKYKFSVALAAIVRQRNIFHVCGGGHTGWLGVWFGDFVVNLETFLAGGDGTLPSHAVMEGLALD